MVTALVGIAGLGAAIVTGIVALCLVEPSWSIYVLCLTAVVLVTTVSKYSSPKGLLLSAVGASPIDRGHPALDRLAALADLPAPALATVGSPVPNAFTAGIRRRDATIVVTSGIERLLTEEEFEAVLAHELAHVANRDAGVMTVASVPRTLGETLIAEEGLIFYVWFLIWWLGIPIWAVGSLLTLALSRYREYAADRGAAILTGRPAALMSALVKLSKDGAAIPTTDLRRLARVEALWVVPTGRARFAVFSDHPPLEKRLARLAEMARELGEPIGP